MTCSKTLSNNLIWRAGIAARPSQIISIRIRWKNIRARRVYAARIPRSKTRRLAVRPCYLHDKFVSALLLIATRAALHPRILCERNSGFVAYFFFFFVDISLTGTLQVPIFNSFFASIPSLSLSLSPCLFFFVYFIPRDTSDFFYTMHAKHAGWTIRGSIHEKVRNTLPVKMPGKVNCCFVLKEARLRGQRAFN